MTATAELSTAVRAGVRDLILALADSKRLLGMRYANWMLGAPELETGIACASMAQDEWGHARLLYALLKDFDDDIEALEHGREPEAYASMEVLDRTPDSWAGLVTLMALADAALTVQFDALSDCCYPPVKQRVEKLCEEERFHAAHASAWFRRLAAGGESRAALTEAVSATAEPLLRWFGPDSERAKMLVDEGVMDAAGSGLRERFVERVAPLLDILGLTDAYRDADPDFDGFDAARRRPTGAGPDEATIRQVRGDLNRAFLLD
ncbi:MAG: phenylacetate-CoA oxygenase subunit PaaI [Gemmatimonadota bacterium]|jgi:ring-1,2-phenylacetyl-CoA epoxidase subunit PaaC